MIDESKIPLLEDLVSKGQMETDDDPAMSGPDEDLDISTEEEEIAEDIQPSETTAIEHKKDELEDDASLRELIIDEEIRMILDKHMDKAYEEIIRLLNHKIS